MENEETAQIRKKLEEHENRIIRLENLFQSKPEAVKKELSIKEFILLKKPNSDVQKTLAIGYYLEKLQGFSSFTVQDLENSFRRAKEQVPQNIQDKIQKNVRKGHMDEATEKKDNKKAYILTSSGERAVENGFKEV